MNTNDVILELRKMQTYNYTIADDEVFNMAVEALAKQIPQNAIKLNNSVGMPYEQCPMCGSIRIFGCYCVNCGQKIYR